MKARHLSIILAGIAVIFAFQACEMVPDPGFDGSISGTITDAANSPVYSDILANTIIVNALGEGDISPTIIRIDGEGKFSYTKLFPKEYKVFIKGPVFVSTPDTARLDFSGGNALVQNFLVVPFLSLKVDLVSAPIDSTVSVNYTIVGNQGKTATTREIYFGTSPHPTNKIGTSAYYSTITKTVTTDSGTIKVTGLKWGAKYYIRMGANGKTGTTNDLMNYSNQLTITTPKK